MKNSNRLLLILKFLLEHTDENHHVTVSDINTYLQEHQLIGDRRTIYDCISELKEIGYEIECVHSTQNHYFIKKREFSLPEVKMLVDAVQSSRFIPQEESQQLIEKLASLTGEYKKEILKRQLYIENRFKTDNSCIVEIVEKIHEAIASNKKIVFQYFDYNVQKEKVLRHDGLQYKLSPYVLIWNNDQYYVVGDCEKHGKITKYRLDRVANLEIIDEERVESPADFSVSDYFSKEFSMLGGEHCTVELICENKLINSLIDKFGTDFSTEIVDDQHFKAKVEVALSGTFYGWVFASCGAMKIVSPDIAVDGFNAVIEKYHL